MQETIIKGDVFILGDIHGRWRTLFYEINRQSALRDCAIICVGDVGIGYNNNTFEEEASHRAYNDFFKERNITFYCIRGNHDNPRYFTDWNKIELSNFKLLHDYSRLIVNDQNWLLVGGAISVDRTFSIERDKKSRGHTSYWRDETFNLDLSKIGNENVDVLITHLPPTWNGPSDKSNIENYCKNDKSVWPELVQERKNLDILIEATVPTSHYCGHFHFYSNVKNGTVNSIILDELQFYLHN